MDEKRKLRGEILENIKTLRQLFLSGNCDFDRVKINYDEIFRKSLILNPEIDQSLGLDKNEIEVNFVTRLESLESVINKISLPKKSVADAMWAEDNDPFEVFNN